MGRAKWAERNGPSDIDLAERVLGPDLARKALWDNPIALYRVTLA